MENDPRAVFPGQAHERESLGGVEQTRFIDVNIRSPELRGKRRVAGTRQKVIDGVRLPEHFGHGGAARSSEPGGFRAHHHARLFTVRGGDEHVSPRREAFTDEHFQGEGFADAGTAAHVEKLVGGSRHVPIDGAELPQPSFCLFAAQLFAESGGVAQHPVDVFRRAEQECGCAVALAANKGRIHVSQTRADRGQECAFLCDDGVSGHHFVPGFAGSEPRRLPCDKEQGARANCGRHLLVGQFAGSQAHRLRDKRVEANHAFGRKDFLARLLEHLPEQSFAFIDRPLLIWRERPRLRFVPEANGRQHPIHQGR